MEHQDDIRWSLSPFFRPAFAMLTRLNTFSQVDLFTFHDKKAKPWIKKAMCEELTQMWYNDSHSAFTKRLYKFWSCNKLSPIMLSKISTTWYHQIACGRGYLKSIRNSYYPHISPRCRLGCASDETPEHIFLQCPHLRTEQRRIRDKCKLYSLRYNLSTIFINDHLKLDVERLLLKLICHQS